MHKQSIFILLLSIVVMCMSTDATSFGKTTFRNRSVGIDEVNQQVGTLHFSFPYDVDYLNGYLGITAGWEQSFKKGVNDELGKYFFFNATNSMNIGTIAKKTLNADGQAITAQALPSVDIYAENIFLNNNLAADGIPFMSTIKINPTIQSVYVDINVRINLDEFVPKLYLDIHAPLNWTRWNMHLKEILQTYGEYISQSTLGNTNNQPSSLNSATAALRGQTIAPALFPDVKQPLLYGKISGAKTTLHVADVETALGYGMYASDAAHIGIDIRAILPTGNAPGAEYIFEPLAGNGHQYGFGAGLSCHYELWNNGYDSSFSMWSSGKIFTMFSSHERRIFDLNKQDGTQNVGSHRLLIKKFDLTGQLTEILFGPNVLALKCRVRNHLQGQATLLFDYQSQGFSLDIGYKFWARSNDKITLVDQLPVNTFGIKGISTGSNGSTAYETASNTQISGQSTLDPIPVFISNNDISILSAQQPCAMTHATFVHANYAWLYGDYTPFIGCGTNLEFSGSSNSAVDLWGAWIKLGFAFS